MELLETFEKKLHRCQRRDVKDMIGDFGYSDICWAANSVKYSPSKKFLACMSDSFLLQKVEKETRELAVLNFNK